MGRRLRIGIVGANAERGWARDAHLGALRALDRADITAVSARTQAGADAAATRFGARKAYADSAALAADPEIDIVAVTVKVPEHRAVVLAALEAGKHVYCEWPLGRDVAESAEMAAVARKAGTHVAVGLQGLSAPAVREASRLVAEGALGRLLSLRAVSPTAGWGRQAPPFYEYLQDRRNGATLATITGGHTLALVELLAGQFASISATASRFVETVKIMGTDRTVERTCADHIVAVGRHDGGCVSSVEVAGGVAGQPFVLELRGTRGDLVIRGRHPGGYQVGALSLEVDGAAVELPVARPGLADASINVSEAYDRFFDAIDGRGRSLPDFDDALRLARVLEAIDVSSEEGRRVGLDAAQAATAGGDGARA
ncbi:MAG: Gfo/Idh/MocA family oxidoreductase [Rhizobiaceae bacterium]|nr:Gfo/Idh/MocA family oxidoreductase [Rhizobiaceae bacterium]